MHYGRTILAVLLGGLLISAGCANQEPEERNRNTRGYEAAKNAPQATGRFFTKDKSQSIVDQKDNTLSPGKPAFGLRADDRRPFVPGLPNIPATGRLLEYQVSLTLESTNLAAARQQLLSLIPKYGYLLSSSWQSDAAGFSLSLKIRATSLYEALLAFPEAGLVISERITVTDHTEASFVSSVRANRAALRTARGPVPGQQGQDNFRADEDADDAEKINRWRINDRITWASVYIHCRGPEVPARVRVPNFQRTLVETVNNILAFLVDLIPALPFLLLILVVILKRERIKAIFSRKKEQK